jgi:hypothetical protein
VTEFNDLTQEEIETVRKDVQKFNRPAPLPEENPKQLTADKLRIEHLLVLPADRATADDNAFLHEQILAGLRRGI